ncbi:MAG: HAD-IA family hydrolase [Bacilli bacterium]|jgi:phosphoglycolate phosphatase|nr:HAD-IA family hydrolase [Bacilli bacterium]
MKYKGFFCDLDGTILDTLTDLVDAVNYALGVYNFPLRTVEEIRSFLGHGSVYLIKNALPPRVDEKVFLEVLEQYKSYYLSHAAQKTAPYPGIKELLNTLKEKGLKLAIITNKPHEIALLLSEIYFPGVFDLVYGQSEVMKRKPDKESLVLAMRKLNLKPEEVFYLGDSLVDKMTAENAKLEYALVSYGFSDKKVLEAANAKNIIDEVDKLWPLLV